MNLKKVIQLIELAHGNDRNEPVLSGSAAQVFGPGGDEKKATHEVNYLGNGKFMYASYSTSFHNGDPYEWFRKDLKPTKKLLEAIVRELTPAAEEAAEEEIRKQQKLAITRSAKARVKSILQDI